MVARLKLVAAAGSRICSFADKRRSSFPVRRSSSGQEELFDRNRRCCPADQSLFYFLRDKIIATGPINVHEYMRLCLSAASIGYYARDKGGQAEQTDVILGARGDFVTSPEVSQMVGEMLAVWLIHEVRCMGHEGHVQLIELGAGTGSLAVDMLRTLSRLGYGGRRHVSLHIVDISPPLIRLQQRNICEKNSVVEGCVDEGRTSFGVSQFGNDVSWYGEIDDVPKAFSVIVANEMFDALPVHQFKKVGGVWREVHVDYSRTEQQLVFALAPTQSLHQMAFLPPLFDRRRRRTDVGHQLERDGTELEVSPQAGILATKLARRLVEHGGGALIIDYGHLGERLRFSLRAYSEQKLVDPLLRAGQVDLTADVDFDFLRASVESDVCLCGPVTQSQFLTAMGIDWRYKILLNKCRTETERHYLTSSKDVLLSPQQMGHRFKVMAMFPKTLTELLCARGGAVGFTTAGQSQSDAQNCSY